MTGAAGRLLADIDGALAVDGMTTRGAVTINATQTAVLVGHAGSTIWPHFQAWRDRDPEPGRPDPLDRWSRHVLMAVAGTFGARAVFPSDRPYGPFQRWAMEAEGLRPSPLGILIHPDYGLWHAYRGALILEGTLDLPLPARRSHPCDACRAKPCLSSCPVDAFDGDGYDVDTCRSFLRSGRGGDCLAKGCRARRACPVGVEYAYDDAQHRFHMTAFARVGK